MVELAGASGIGHSIAGGVSVGFVVLASTDRVIRRGRVFFENRFGNGKNDIPIYRLVAELRVINDNCCRRETSCTRFEEKPLWVQK